MPLVDLACVVLDCADAEPVAAFYAAAGGGEVTNLDATGAYVDFAGLLLAIRVVEDYQPPTWPGAEVPMQFHLDFYVDDVEAAEAALRAAGATTPRHQPHRGDGLVVMLDPAGHPFCIGARK
jgi:catechol 2,3-dioxygenase-like lactoylglutathione lyase family enzyme